MSSTELLDSDTYYQTLYNLIKWTKQETDYKIRVNQRKKVYENFKLRLSQAINIKLKESLIGEYLAEFNVSQKQGNFINENKLGITQTTLKNMSPQELKAFNKRNDIFDDMINLVEQCVREMNVIKMRNVFQLVTNMRVSDSYVNIIDRSLKKFSNLRVLVLTGNWIQRINGGCFPPELSFLELADNAIKSLKGLKKFSSNKLMHLGLNRNFLSNDSSLHLLSESANFLNLKTLDLSDNDISDLEKALQALKGLVSLKSLLLEGNPCAVVMAYKAATVSYFPSLNFLDGTELLETDKINKSYRPVDLTEAALFFECFCVQAIPPPPVEKGANQVYFLEVSFPLLEPIHELGPGELEYYPVQGIKFKNHGRPNFIYTEANNWAGNDLAFKTEELPYSPNLSFSPVFIKPPEGKLHLIRDTLRTKVNVKLIYMVKVIEKDPRQSLKSNSKKKDQKGKGKDKKASADKVELKNVEEMVAKKITLADFNCSLRNLNWSDETIDFYWSSHPKAGINATRLEGSIKAGKNLEPLPSNLTVQIGFGLVRSE